ncbi:alkaline phosphatase family protein [Streptomyces cinereoruber]|uniref:hypothetical protein n=1 Tax=Streptomyces cinereoruber TaxID=67260 RepID=UPI00363B068E
MTSTHRATIPVRQLPIQLRPQAGEGRIAFIERLATANFLKPNYLRSYLRDPDSPKTTPSWERLAAVTGRDAAILMEILERKHCVECGEPMPIKNHLTPRRRCSQACRQKSYRRRHPKPSRRSGDVIAVCPQCSSQFVQPAQHGQRRYCSATCTKDALRTRWQRKAAPPTPAVRACRSCEAPISSGPAHKLYCSKECSYWAYMNRRRDRGLPRSVVIAPPRQQPADCPVCGNPLPERRSQSRLTCSASCRMKRYRARRKERLGMTT